MSECSLLSMGLHQELTRKTGDRAGEQRGLSVVCVCRTCLSLCLSRRTSHASDLSSVRGSGYCHWRRIEVLREPHPRGRGTQAFLALKLEQKNQEKPSWERVSGHLLLDEGQKPAQTLDSVWRMRQCSSAMGKSMRAESDSL